MLVVIGLFWDAPLEQLANPMVTPNPAKAPWYFLGLQELLHYFPPVVAGILIPTLVVLGLVVIPYSKVNIEGRPFWDEPRRATLPHNSGACWRCFWCSWRCSTPGRCWFRRRSPAGCWWLPMCSAERRTMGGIPARSAAVVVGDDLVHRGRHHSDRGGNVFPRTRLVLGLALEINMAAC